jgi:hypothetical protein
MTLNRLGILNANEARKAEARKALLGATPY